MFNWLFKKRREAKKKTEAVSKSRCCGVKDQSASCNRNDDHITNVMAITEMCNQATYGNFTDNMPARLNQTQETHHNHTGHSNNHTGHSNNHTDHSNNHTGHSNNHTDHSNHSHDPGSSSYDSGSCDSGSCGCD